MQKRQHKKVLKTSILVEIGIFSLEERVQAWENNC